MTRPLATACLLTIAATSFAAEPKTLVMERTAIHDKMVSAANSKALTFLKPKGWDVSGGIRWEIDSWHQAGLAMKVSNPKSREQLQTFDTWGYVWLTNPVFPMKSGSNYMGTIVLYPPKDMEEAFTKYTIPAIRKGAKLVSCTPMNDLAKLLTKQSGMTVVAAKARIEYSLDGEAIEEDLYMGLYLSKADIGGGCTSYNWGPAFTPFAIRAAKGELDGATPRMLAMAHSIEFNPGWCSDVVYVQGLFQKRMGLAIQGARDISNTISANNDAILQMMRESRATRDAAYERTSRNFSDYIRGLDAYGTGSGTTYKLPIGYSQAWSGSDGTVILSNDTNFDPNRFSNQSWKELRPLR